MLKHCLKICSGLLLISLSVTLVYESNAGTFTVKQRRERVRMAFRVMSAQFLARATFGPTSEDIEALTDRMMKRGPRLAMGDWIDDQFNLPATMHEPLVLQMIQDDGFDPITNGINAARYRHHAWWHSALTSKDQLRQRMAWALSQIFVTNDQGAGFNSIRNDQSGQPMYFGPTNYYDMLVKNSFRSYRETLGDVTLHPVMGTFLSHVKNPKGNPSIGQFPDENYAREVLQLLSIGLYELKKNGEFRTKKGELIETYDNETIKAFARVFTGLSFEGSSSFFGARINLHDPMEMYETQHDADEKELLNGTILPAGQAGLDDIGDALDNIAAHPNVAPFISRQLIQRFVKSSPSRAYINRVSRVFDRTDGDWPSVIKAVLLDWEALVATRFRFGRNSVQSIPRGTLYSKLREPVLRYTSFIRAFHPVSDYPTTRLMMNSLRNDMNQAPYQSPSVFNFYPPDYQPPAFQNHKFRRLPGGQLVGPEFQILTAVTANRLPNRLRSDVNDATANFTLLNNANGVFRSNISLDFGPEQALAGDLDALLSHLDLLLCSGSLSDKSKAVIAEAIESETADPATRAKAAILAVLSSPECAVSE